MDEQDLQEPVLRAAIQERSRRLLHTPEYKR
jgi:hypothetical protein